MPMPRCRAGTCCMARPPMRMAPAVGVSKPASIIRQVVLPEPDGPSRVRNSPLRICRSRSRTTRVRPSKLLLMCSNSNIRKVCGGNRTRHGADSQQVLASVVRTARQRDLDLPPLIATMLRAADPVVPDAFGLPPPPA